jgi:hypothetical protein
VEWRKRLSPITLGCRLACKRHQQQQGYQ